MADGDGGKADDGVHRGPDIVGHIGQEGSFGLIGVLGLHQGVLEGPGLLQLLLDLIRNIPGHHHDHDIPRIVVLRHDKGLPDTDPFPGAGQLPIVRRDLGRAPQEALL